MIKYLVARTEIGGVDDAQRRGWTRVAKDRFATPEKDDVRLVWRFNQMIPDPGGVTRFVMSKDFPVDPNAIVEGELVNPDCAAFAEFATQGHAEWEE